MIPHGALLHPTYLGAGHIAAILMVTIVPRRQEQRLELGL